MRGVGTIQFLQHFKNIPDLHLAYCMICFLEFGLYLVSVCQPDRGRTGRDMMDLPTLKAAKCWW